MTSTPPAPAPSAPHLVEVETGGLVHHVRFNLARLDAIETAMSVGSVELARQLSGYLPAAKQGPDGKTEADPESVTRVVTASRVGFMGRFVGACIDVPFAQLEEKVPAGELWSTFYTLALGFIAAVMDLQGVRPEGKVPAPEGAASGSSGPGPASSSGSEPTSSAASPRGSSQT